MNWKNKLSRDLKDKISDAVYNTKIDFAKTYLNIGEYCIIKDEGKKRYFVKLQGPKGYISLVEVRKSETKHETIVFKL